MALIEFSVGLMSGLPARVIFPNTDVNAPGFFTTGDTMYAAIPLMPYWFDWPQNNQSQYAYRSAILVYQGAVPSNLSSLTLWTSRSSDTLITFTNNLSNTFSSTINVNTNPVNISSTFVSASATGTATWFRLMVAGYAAATQNILHQIVGTVGLTGSGSDLEIDNTNIVSGSNYRIQSLRLQFPTGITY